ncbi:hypothetical protein AAFF_G00165660 [Aldrovandia affinis]|uniref:Uncharacterized protein n=1 Tax=Aldrovandia affinis TaxID=143900 RepID=A0AAD7W835_9TELE|nr:hypothetical protein AAFF_G00165660 [Aldrovandia affinis]
MTVNRRERQSSAKHWAKEGTRSIQLLQPNPAKTEPADDPKSSGYPVDPNPLVNWLSRYTRSPGTAEKTENGKNGRLLCHRLGKGKPHKKRSMEV